MLPTPEEVLQWCGATGGDKGFLLSSASMRILIKMSSDTIMSTLQERQALVHGILLCGDSVRQFGRRFAHGFSFEQDFMGIVEQAIQNGVGHGRIPAQKGMPVVNRELAGNQRRTCVVAIIEALST